MFDKTILVDLDGTIADTSGRQHFVRVRYDENGKKLKKDWKSFFAGIPNDPVRWEVVDIVNRFAYDHNIVYMSGRGEEFRDVTEAWLKRWGLWRVDQALYMRAKGDSRDDSIVKEELREQVIRDGYVNPYIAIDDRNRVKRKWLSLGMIVIDVGTGEEF
jgi:FMN phosphatase YigB (HAD superfamily)